MMNPCASVISVFLDPEAIAVGGWRTRGRITHGHPTSKNRFGDSNDGEQDTQGHRGQRWDCMDIWLRSCAGKSDEPEDERRRFERLKGQKRRVDLRLDIYRVAMA